MIEKDEKKESHIQSVRGSCISFFLALGIFLLSAFPVELYAQGSVSSSVSGAGPSDSLDMQI